MPLLNVFGVLRADRLAPCEPKEDNIKTSNVSTSRLSLNPEVSSHWSRRPRAERLIDYFGWILTTANLPGRHTYPHTEPLALDQFRATLLGIHIALSRVSVSDTTC